MRKKVDFLSKLKHDIGEQKIDVVFDRHKHRAIDKIALSTGVKLWVKCSLQCFSIKQSLILIDRFWIKYPEQLYAIITHKNKTLKNTTD